MSDGTASAGRKKKGTHGICRRCGNKSFNISKGKCSSCGFGKTKKMRNQEWKNKKVTGERKD